MPEIYDIRPALDKYPVPVTVIQGDYDYMDPSASHWTELKNQYPMIRLLVIKDASHYSWIDESDAFRRYFQLGLRSYSGNYTSTDKGKTIRRR